MNQEKRKIFQEHLKEQERQREVIQERKRIAQEKKNNPQEDMLFIQKEFRILQQEMDDLYASLKKGEAKIDDLHVQYSKIKKYYIDINYVLTTYDRQFYKQILQKMNANILELKKKYQPKKPFKFSRRDQDFGVKAVEQVQQLKHMENKASVIAGVQNKTGQEIVITKECPSQGSFKVMNCHNTKVEILQKTQILFLKNLRDCTIKTALTKSTVFVDDCTNCIFQLNCHQLRIHNSNECTFGIFVTSKAIIEDCNKVIFRPYSFDYAEKEKHEIDFQRKDKQNLWRDIQDFNWLKQNQKSPHFQLVQ